MTLHGQDSTQHDTTWTDDHHTTTQTYYDANESWNDADDESSGNSYASEPIDLEDVANMTTNNAGETLYLGYRTAKRLSLIHI